MDGILSLVWGLKRAVGRSRRGVAALGNCHSTDEGAGTDLTGVGGFYRSFISMKQRLIVMNFLCCHILSQQIPLLPGR
jgi:hypothetical protein